MTDRGATVVGEKYFIVCLQCGAAGPKSVDKADAVVLWGLRGVPIDYAVEAEEKYYCAVPYCSTPTRMKTKYCDEHSQKLGES